METRQTHIQSANGPAGHVADEMDSAIRISNTLLLLFVCVQPMITNGCRVYASGLETCVCLGR